MAGKPTDFRPPMVQEVPNDQELALAQKSIFIDQVGGGFIIADLMLGEGRHRYRGVSEVWRTQPYMVSDPFKTKVAALEVAQKENTGGADDDE